jgi:hypothetical protein
MYNLNTHIGYKSLSEYLGKFITLTNEEHMFFDEFLKECMCCAENIANSINENNYAVYGFNYFEKRYYPNHINELRIAIKNKVIGDIFELFAGFFVQYFDTGYEWGIRKGTYNFGGGLNNDFAEADLGMDGFGLFTSTNENAVMQVKYRSNPNDKPFNKDVFMSLFGEAILKKKIESNNPNQRLIFFTNIPIGTASSWDGKTKQFNDCCAACEVPVVKVGYNEIVNLVGCKKMNRYNADFWHTFHKQFEINNENQCMISW